MSPAFFFHRLLSVFFFNTLSIFSQRISLFLQSSEPFPTSLPPLAQPKIPLYSHSFGPDQHQVNAPVTSAPSSSIRSFVHTFIRVSESPGIIKAYCFRLARCSVQFKLVTRWGTGAQLKMKFNDQELVSLKLVYESTQHFWTSLSMGGKRVILPHGANNKKVLVKLIAPETSIHIISLNYLIFAEFKSNPATQGNNLKSTSKNISSAQLNYHIGDQGSKKGLIVRKNRFSLFCRF